MMPTSYCPACGKPCVTPCLEPAGYDGHGAPIYEHR